MIKIEKARVVSPSGDIFWNELSFQLDSGQVHALVGESGSGKTTLIRGILGLIPNGWEITAREWMVLERDYHFWSQNPKKRGEDFYFMPQNPGSGFHPYREVGEEIELCFPGFRKEEERQKLFGLWEEFGLPIDLYARKPHTLSGGEKQRVLLSLVVALPPKLLLLDEPTSGLDRKNENWFYDCISKVKKQGTSVVFITHEFRLLKRIADSYSIIKKGEIAETGFVSNHEWYPKSKYGQDLKNLDQFFSSSNSSEPGGKSEI